MLISRPRIPTPISATVAVIALLYGVIIVLCSTGTKNIGR
jgi:hypothetical protein